MQNPSFEREITRGLPIKRERLLDSFLFIYLFFFFFSSLVQNTIERELLEEGNSREMFATERLTNHSPSLRSG